MVPRPRRVRPVSHEDQLSLVDHLDELRHRLIVCLVIFAVALALAFWQNHLLLEIAGHPLPSGHKKLITFGVTEPFTTTLTVSAYGAAILAAPFILWQLYAYILPAFSPAEKSVILPILLLFPVLFIAGIAFSYFAVMPAAVHFLLNFNDNQFNVQVRASDYYSFFSMTMLAGRADLPAADGDPRGHPPRDRQSRADHQEPPLRLSGDRGRRRGAARSGPDLDADRDGPATGSI